MGKLIDLTGQRFGRLKVIERDANTNGCKPAWRCECDCGEQVIVPGSDLKAQKVVSCGCFKREQLHNRNFIHGQEKCRLYGIWKGMKQRCTNPNHRSFSRYGGRGIKVCEAWMHDYQAFQKWAFAHGYRDNMSIDRIDNNKGYSPENCRWATRTEQNNNTTSNHLITYKGQTKTQAQWATERHINKSVFYSRIKRGWTIEEALEFVPRKKS